MILIDNSRQTLTYPVAAGAPPSIPAATIIPLTNSAPRPDVIDRSPLSQKALDPLFSF
jgi:hypothetical protein